MATETAKSEFTKKLEELLDGTSQISKDEGGERYVEIYADYRDEFGDSNIKELADSDDPSLFFDDKLHDIYWDYGDDLIDEVIEDIREDEELYTLYEKEDDPNHDYLDYLRDSVREMVYVKYPEDHYLDETVHFDIMLDTGDANYDFTCNNILNYCAEEEINENSSMMWVCDQLGYKEQVTKAIEECRKDFEPVKEMQKMNVQERLNKLWEKSHQLPSVATDASPNQIILPTVPDTKEWMQAKLRLIAQEKSPAKQEEYLSEWENKFGLSSEKEVVVAQYYSDTIKDPFVKAVIEEFENLTSHMGALTMTVDVTLREAITIMQKTKDNQPFDLNVGKGARFGLYDKWNGGGSLMDVVLPKDIKIPSRNIFKAVPDCSLQYSIEDVYGATGEQWEDGSVKMEENTLFREADRGDKYVCVKNETLHGFVSKDNIEYASSLDIKEGDYLRYNEELSLWSKETKEGIWYAEMSPTSHVPSYKVKMETEAFVLAYRDAVKKQDYEAKTQLRNALRDERTATYYGNTIKPSPANETIELYADEYLRMCEDKYGKENLVAGMKDTYVYMVNQTNDSVKFASMVNQALSDKIAKDLQKGTKVEKTANEKSQNQLSKDNKNRDTESR